jgi:hypothetical protein
MLVKSFSTMQSLEQPQERGVSEETSCGLSGFPPNELFCRHVPAIMCTQKAWTCDKTPYPFVAIVPVQANACSFRFTAVYLQPLPLRHPRMAEGATRLNRGLASPGLLQRRIG